MKIHVPFVFLNKGTQILLSWNFVFHRSFEILNLIFVDPIKISNFTQIE
jgi:hypothetical protein